MTCLDRYNLAQGMCMPGFVEKMAWQTHCHGKMNIDINMLTQLEFNIKAHPNKVLAGAAVAVCYKESVNHYKSKGFWIQ